MHTGSGTDVEPVIGLVVAAGVGRAGHLSWMIPLDVVARYWRPLAGLMQGERRAGAQDDAAVGDRLVRALAGLHSVRDRGTLRRIVELLPDVVRMELGARAGTPSVDEIVEVCRRWSGGLRDLIHTVAYFERDINGGRQDLTDGIITEFGGHDLQPERPPARYSGALQPEHRKLLVNALRGFERLRSPVARRVFLEMLVDDVSEGSGARLSIEVSADLVVDIHEIVNKCHGIPGAPQKMLAILRNFCDDERPALDNLALQIGTVYLEALLTDAERAAILGLLRDLPVEVLDRAYAQCLPAFALRQGGPLAAGDYLRQVERMTAPDGLPRVIVFAEHVAGRAETVRGPLRAWSDRLAIRMRIVRDQIEDLRRGIVVGDEAPEPSYLVCRITPDGVDPHQYVYSATIQIGSGPARALASSDDAADLATTKTKIGSTLKTVPRELNYNLDALTVELVLPRSLLTEPVDQWQFRDTQPYVLGQRRRLVIRSYERMSSDRDDLWPQWFEKWRAVEDQMTTGTHVMVFTADSGAMAEPDIRRLSSPDVTLLALGRPPYERADLETPDAITAALSEGVPFVIWCRDGKLSTEFRRTLETFLHHKPVRDLPNQVFRWRRQTDEAGDDVARFAGELSLVACDATRGSHVALRYLNSPRRG
ncbi:hypothetical protein J2S43_001338 [Catenuloplanes nepalensis]|uniref:Uncharacterized protein n=1 Tax=Catenuloplanes nepalensis TaxID=587533 RepID=A0ABT9MNB8_9ACTN|nr:hypothetical protein [Catenuloplanes nepalensis]MDP9792826.1 hypothetical protein [Catenuloplanes nepalensis]